MKFSREKKRDIVLLYESGKEAKEIAAIFGDTPDQISSILYKEGIRLGYRNTFSRNKDEVLRLYNKGYSISKIADRIGLTRNTLCYHLQRMGITNRRNRYKQIHLWKYQRSYLLHKEGKSLAEIAKMMGLTRSAIIKQIRKWKLHNEK